MNKKLEEDIKRALITKQRGTCILSVEILEIVLKHIDNSISKEVILDKIRERQFELQQEYIDFKDDIKLNTLQELLEGK